MIQQYRIFLSTIILCHLLVFNQTLYAMDNPFKSKESSSPKIVNDWYIKDKNFYYSESRLQQLRDETTYGIKLNGLDNLLASLCHISRQTSVTKKADYIAELFQTIPKDKAKEIIEENKDFFNSKDWIIIDDFIEIKDTNQGTYDYLVIIQDKQSRLIYPIRFEMNKSGISNIEFY